MLSNKSDLVLCIPVGYTVFWIGIHERMPRQTNGITFLFHDRRARPTWAFVWRDIGPYCSRLRGVGYGTLFHSRRSVER